MSCFRLIAKRRNFAQIEDFNKQGGKSARALPMATFPGSAPELDYKTPRLESYFGKRVV